GWNVNRQVFDELLPLKQRDTDMRSRLLQEGKLYGDYAPEMQQVHRENAKRLDEIIAKHGWPGVSLVGLEGCRAAWLIAQHSICTPDLQGKFLALLAKPAADAEARKRQVASFTNGIGSTERKPKVYVTVLDWNKRVKLSCKF